MYDGIIRGSRGNVESRKPHVARSTSLSETKSPITLRELLMLSTIVYAYTRDVTPFPPPALLLYGNDDTPHSPNFGWAK